MFEADSLCKGCGNQVIKARFPLGGSVLVNPKPDDEGNVRLEEREGKLTAVYDTTINLFGKDERYMAHAYTCNRRLAGNHGRA